MGGEQGHPLLWGGPLRLSQGGPGAALPRARSPVLLPPELASLLTWQAHWAGLPVPVSLPLLRLLLPSPLRPLHLHLRLHLCLPERLLLLSLSLRRCLRLRPLVLLQLTSGQAWAAQLP